MHVAREWQLKPRAVVQPLPAQPASLTTALQGMLPLPQDFIADPAQLTFAVVQGKVLVEAAQHHREVMLLLASSACAQATTRGCERETSCSFWCWGCELRQSAPFDPPHRHV